MRILILTLGSRGDVQPFIALGAALRARGHDVTLTTGQGFEAMIEAHGLAAAPISVDFRALLQTPMIRKALNSFSGKLQAWRATRDMTRRQLDEIWAIARDLRPALIVHHPKVFVAPQMAEALRAIAVPTFLLPAFAPTDAFASPILPLTGLGRFGNRLSHRLLLGLMRFACNAGLRDWRRQRPQLPHFPVRDPIGGYHPRGDVVPRLQAFSRHLVPRPGDWGHRERITGCWFLDRASDWTPSRGLARFLDQGPSPVYVGFGSIPAQDAERQTRSVVEALRRVGQRGILATGWGGLESMAGSERIHVLESAPHDWLFPRCAAVVHHGGAGTTHEALRWGRPSIVCPVFADQPFWGRRVMALGAGPAPLPQKRLTAVSLAGALSAALSPAVATRAAAIGAALRAEPGASGAADLLESLMGLPPDGHQACRSGS